MLEAVSGRLDLTGAQGSLQSPQQGVGNSTSSPSSPAQPEDRGYDVTGTGLTPPTRRRRLANPNRQLPTFAPSPLMDQMEEMDIKVWGMM